MRQVSYALSFGALLTGTVCAADDPFCGKWKLNKEKSKITGEQMKMEDLGNNKLKFADGVGSDTVSMDGTD
jgi:hypothetical protein